MNEGEVRMECVASRAEVMIASQRAERREGAGEPCTVLRIEGEGPVSSDDPRLRGIFRANAVIVLDDDGVGVSRDVWEIVDSQTGARKAHGTAHGIHGGPGPVRALSLGELSDGSRFFAEARVAIPAPGSGDPIVIEYGDADPAIPGTRALVALGDVEGLFR